MALALKEDALTCRKATRTKSKYTSDGPTPASNAATRIDAGAALALLAVAVVVQEGLLAIAGSACRLGTLHHAPLLKGSPVVGTAWGSWASEKSTSCTQ
jgi:hypothetical protein